MADFVHVSQHPLVRHKLSLLRCKDTEQIPFRQLVRELSQLLFYEATQNLPVEPCKVQTPLGECGGHTITAKVGLMPILRAGLGMADAILDLAPGAQVWHLGLYRDHATLEPVIYYQKLPPKPTADFSIVLDPMLATGGSATAAVDMLKKWGTPHIKFLGLIAAPEGVQTLQKAHPDVPIYLAAIDRHLTENGSIIPGLGHAGCRQFGT